MEFGGLVAVKDVSFEVKKGEFIGLIGPNGCGKSTTFNCISGLLQQTSGTVEVFGKDVSDKRPDQIQKLGMTRTFQHTRLWKDMTVIENLLVPPRKQFSPNPFLSLFRGRSRPAEKERLADAFAVLDQLEVPHMAHNMAGELSGGQSKLVDIGRSMMGSPDLAVARRTGRWCCWPSCHENFHQLCENWWTRQASQFSLLNTTWTSFFAKVWIALL
jgi:branched-chain amino acid transport system ATP-binding protein